MDAGNRNIHGRFTFRLLIAVLIMIHLIRIITEGVRPIDYVMMVLELLIVLIMAVEAGIQIYVWWSKKRKLASTFGLKLHADYCTQLVQARPITLPVEVTINHPTEVRIVNFRFTSKPRKGRVSPIIGRIENVRHEGMYLSTLSDGKGGLIAEFRNPPFRGSGNRLFFTVEIMALAPWSGYLTFESYDAESNLRCISQPIIFTDKPSQETL